MGTGHLQINLSAVAENWRALDAMTACETAAVVKADGYGLGADRVAEALSKAGARTFFVAVAEEGTELRAALGESPEIAVFSGHMTEDTAILRDARLTPMLNSAEQVARHLSALPGHPFGIQLDSGMNRLGLEPADWARLRTDVLAANPSLLMSHLACADEPERPMNTRQLAAFREMTDGIDVPKSLSATGGILLGPDYHFDLTRPGIGLYGGLPFSEANPVIRLDLPVIQTRDLAAGETVGYGNSWLAPGPTRIATVSGGYADGLIRHLSNRATLWMGDAPCRLRGRVSMDLLTVEIPQDADPDHLTLIGPHQGVDTLAEAAGTIGYEILTSLGPRYRRSYA